MEAVSSHPVQRGLRLLRRGLDWLYLVCGGLGAICIIVLLGIIVAQMLARWTGQLFAGATDYAGYFMAAASFFALAYTLNYGSHIRVGLVLERLGRFRRFGELWCTTIATATAWFFCYYAIKTNFLSHKLNDVSQGQDATPLWVPQIAMSIGVVVFCIALTDHLVRLVFSKHTGVPHRAIGGLDETPEEANETMETETSPQDGAKTASVAQQE